MDQHCACRIVPELCAMLCAGGNTCLTGRQAGRSCAAARRRPTLRLRLPQPYPCIYPQGWSRFTTGAFELHKVEGHHLWPLDKGSKAMWLGAIAAQLEQLQL